MYGGTAIQRFSNVLRWRSCPDGNVVSFFIAVSSDNSFIDLVDEPERFESVKAVLKKKCVNVALIEEVFLIAWASHAYLKALERPVTV